MALYEGNFIKLNQLVNDLSHRAVHGVSFSARDADLHLEIEGRTRYTCSLRMTYFFPEATGLAADPDLRARIYFDARLAEVCGWAERHYHDALRTLTRQCRSELDHRWRVNIMFSKWLDFVLEHGHRFPATC